MEEDRRGSSRRVWKVSGGSTPHQLCQEDIPEVFGVSLHLCIGGLEIVPVNRDEPVGLEVGFPLVADQFFQNQSSGIGSGVDSLKSLVQKYS